MSRVPGRKKRIIGATVALVAIGGGAAFAYWTANGTANTEATAGSSTGYTVTAEASSGELTPGGPTQTVSFTVTNPGTGVQKVQKVTVTVADEAGNPWNNGNGCSSADFQVGTTDFAAEIEPGQSADGTVTLRMINADRNQDGCKGVKVPLHVAVN